MQLAADDLLTGVALALVFEGLLYAMFPDGMKRAMAMALSVPSGQFRSFGLALAGLGVFCVWLIRG